MAKELTAERLRELLSYDPETGHFHWRLAVKGIQRGARAGCDGKQGYVLIRVDRVLYSAQRLAWFHVHGEWPKGVVDHINHDSYDNRLANLRDVTHTTNMHNRRGANKNSKSGVLGVNPFGHKWIARITRDRKCIYLGVFKTLDEAAKAASEAKAQAIAGA